MIPNVSVLVPVYNVKKYLRKCMESIISQSLTDIEIVCVDDGSDDGSEVILDEYATMDSRIKVIHKENSGYGASLNVALSYAEGEYIAIVETDDFIDPDMFENLYRTAKEHSLEVIKSQFYDYTDAEGDTYKTLFSGVPSNELTAPPFNMVLRPLDYPDLFHGYVYLWSGLYSHQFLIDNNIRFNETPGASFQDIGFTYKVLLSAGSLMYIDNAYYHYRRDNENASTKSNSKIFCVSEEFDEIWRYVFSNPEIYKKARFVLPSAQFRRYGETRGRLDQNARNLFEERFFGDFEFLKRMNLINSEYWSKDAWNDYSTRMNDFVESEPDYISKCIIQRMQNYNGIVIYGAGRIGTEIVRNCRRLNVLISDVVVTSSEDKENYVDDIKVHSIDDSDIGIRGRSVLICVKGTALEEIADELEKRGIYNYIKLDSGLRSILATSDTV